MNGGAAYFNFDVLRTSVLKESFISSKETG